MYWGLGLSVWNENTGDFTLIIQPSLHFIVIFHLMLHYSLQALNLNTLEAATVS